MRVANIIVTTFIPMIIDEYSAYFFTPYIVKKVLDIVANTMMTDNIGNKTYAYG